MAIYHFSVSTISRAKGRSATAAAAYRSGTVIKDERTGQTFDYRRKNGVVYCGLVDGKKEEAPDARELLWNAAEAVERRKDAKVAREVVVALPSELPFHDNVRLARGMALWIRERHGVAVDIAVHAPDPGGDERNIHAHLLLSTRVYDGEKFGGKTKELDRKPESREHLCAWRKEWEKRANRALEKAGRHERISCMSLKDAHELNDLPPVEPCEHLGPIRTQVERRGERTRAGNRNRARISERWKRGRFIRERMKLDCKISEEEREYYRSVVKPEKKEEEEETEKQVEQKPAILMETTPKLPVVPEEEASEKEDEQEKRRLIRNAPSNPECQDRHTQKRLSPKELGEKKFLSGKLDRWRKTGDGWEKKTALALNLKERRRAKQTFTSAVKRGLFSGREREAVTALIDAIDDATAPQQQRSGYER